MDWLLIIVATCSALLLMRMIATSVHEMGHAIACYFFTQEKIEVYLGSYGEQQKSKRIAIGRFEVWFRLNPLKWKGGLCVHSGAAYRHKYIIILGGPIASLLLFGLTLALFLQYRPEGLPGALLFIFCIWSGQVFLYNIVPSGEAMALHDGEMSYNDGANLRMLWLNEKMPSDYNLALEHYNENRYYAAAVLLDKIISEGTKNEFVYRFAVLANIELKNYQKAASIQKEQVAKIGNLNAEDRISLALLKTYLGNYGEAIDYYRHLLQNEGNNKYNLNNLGYTLTLVNRFAEAVPYLDKAISIDKNFAPAYSNRGFAKMKLGRLEDGKLDNDIALGLDPDNAYALRNAGFYLLEKGRYDDALIYLNRAQEIEIDTPLVGDYIGLAKSSLGRN